MLEHYSIFFFSVQYLFPIVFGKISGQFLFPYQMILSWFSIKM
jgi:hypothetical protein